MVRRMMFSHANTGLVAFKKCESEYQGTQRGRLDTRALLIVQWEFQSQQTIFLTPFQRIHKLLF